MRTRPRPQLVRRLILAFAIVGTATSFVPLAAAGGGDDEPLRVRFEAPVVFTAPTPGCPEGVADFGISTLGKVGSATNCLQSFAVVECAPGVVALFCQELDVHMTLRLHGSRMEADLTLVEVWNCGDPDCLTFSVDQQWPGVVVFAKGRFNKLEGARVSGGGTIVFDAATFDLLSLDEAIAIGAE